MLQFCFCNVSCKKNKRFQLLRRCAITFASPCVITFPYKTASKVIRPQPCSQVIATLVAEIGHKADNRRHQNCIYLLNGFIANRKSPAPPETTTSNTLRLPNTGDTYFHCIYIGFTDVPNTSRNVERKHHPNDINMLILP